MKKSLKKTPEKKAPSQEFIQATPLVTVAPEEVADIKNGLRLQIIDDTTGDPIAALVSAEDYAFLEEVDAKLDAQDVAELAAIREESAQKGTISLDDFLQTLDD